MDQNNIGTCIIVNGAVVAWFNDFNDEALDWCSANHFGEWLAFSGNSPTIIPLTEKELENINSQAELLLNCIRNNSDLE